MRPKNGRSRHNAVPCAASVQSISANHYCNCVSKPSRSVRNEGSDANHRQSLLGKSQSAFDPHPSQCVTPACRWPVGRTQHQNASEFVTLSQQGTVSAKTAAWEVSMLTAVPNIKAYLIPSCRPPGRIQHCTGHETDEIIRL
jgi:hypothetical protein